jgi:hypothetical protein
MSTVDEKVNIVPQEDAIAEASASPPNNPDKNESSQTGGFILLFFIVGFVAAMVLGWVVFPKLLYSKKSQPFDFNHALHMEEVGEGCESCHYFREDGSFAGVPTLDTCIDCHAEVLGDSADEAIFVEEYVANEREVPWLIYSKQPDCVFFSHTAHIHGANMDCVTCHGHIGESESLKPYEQNRISGYSRDIWGKNIAGFKRNTWDRMKMNDCAACHKETGMHASSVQTQKDACFVCHK